MNGSAPDKRNRLEKGNGFLSITIAMESTLGNEVETETDTRPPVGARRGAFTIMALLGVPAARPNNAVTAPATVSAAKPFRGQSATSACVGLIRPASAAAAITPTATVPLSKVLRSLLLTRL